jgi:ketosteroid isomerase-like protein
MNGNKAIVHAFYEKMNQLDAPGMLALMAEDATWWIPTDTIGGVTNSKQQMAVILAAMFAVYAQGPRMEIGRLVAEGDWVCAEVKARESRTKGGVQYENDYLMFFTIRKGLICEVREFLNPLFVGPLAAEVAASAT